MMHSPAHLYYNISDTLHARELENTLLHDNVMSKEQALGVKKFLHSLKHDTPLDGGDLPVRVVCVQGDAGTGKTQAIVSLCSILPCPIVVGSTNPSFVNVAQRCRAAFPYGSCVQAQLSGTAWAAMHWNIGLERIGDNWEKKLQDIYAECMSTRSVPTEEQDKEIYRILNKSLFPKMREKFTAECDTAGQKKIYEAWAAARTGSKSFSSKDKAMMQLYEMFCSVPPQEITQEDFNAALAFRCPTAFTETLPRSLLSNFLLIEEAARLPAYFFRILAYRHYLVRFALKPPGYKDTVFTICFVGSPLQSTVINCPDFSVMDEAVLDAEKRGTHVSIYTVNRRTSGTSLKAAALATVVQVLENDCPLQEEHCRLLDPFVVAKGSFMDPKVAPSAMRLTHYHKTAIEFINKANSQEDEVVTFYEYILVSEGVKAMPGGNDNTIQFLSRKGAICMPYRSTRAKDIRKECVFHVPLQMVVTGEGSGGSPDGDITYNVFAMKRTLGKRTPVTVQHTTQLMPIEFTGTYRVFNYSAALSNSCNEQLWSLRTCLSFAAMLCRALPEDESYALHIVIDDVWAIACRYAADLDHLHGVEEVEDRASISACLTEAQDSLWRAVAHADSVGFVDTELRVTPFCGTECGHFPMTIVRGDRFDSTVTLEDAVELTRSEFTPDPMDSVIRIPRTHRGSHKSLLCISLINKIHGAVSSKRMQLHDLLLRAPSGILFRTMNVVAPDLWSCVFPTLQFFWQSAAAAAAAAAAESDDGGADHVEPRPKKAKNGTTKKRPPTTMTTSRAVGGATRGFEPSHKESSEDDDDDDGDGQDKEDKGPCDEETTSIIHLLHTIYDSRVRTIDSVQGDTITRATFVDVESIGTMGQLTVALTRNTDAELLMLTSSEIRHILPRDPITKFVRLSARDTHCYYVK
jgi:hypothetical protein